MTGKQLSMQNARVVDTSETCEECGRSTAPAWHYCPYCGSEDIELQDEQ